ncbi:MAG TPA: aryl-sulfate sulfotransferase [Candidatus Eisenbacteria bacterium]|nr:aryl-sulfate sulfotransferase [Candidatus Eisenbacteria bacterium]
MLRTPRFRALSVLALAAMVSGFAAPLHAATPPPPGFLYVSPLPGSTLNLPATNVIVRPGGPIDPASLDPLTTVTLAGSFTGAHAGRLRLSDDGETIVVRPSLPFLPGESVTCRIAPGIRSTSGESFPGATFEFHLVGARIPSTEALFSIEAADAAAFLADTPAAARSGASAAATAPGSPPALHVVTPGATAPGDVFVSDLRLDDIAYPSHLLRVRNEGSIAFERALPGRGFDFKRQGDRLTYFDGAAKTHYALDPLDAVVDSFRCGNGYETDPHDLVLLPNGHALVMAYDTERVDMSRVVTGGRADALVTGLVVQELDLEKEVVFQWRSWDHFAVTDATRRDPRAAFIDYCHGNAVEPDADGNVLLSSRHMDEVTKISRATGEIVWRLGGRNNQFAFIGDSERFSHQHAVRRLANGRLLLFDNGNFKTPLHSRVVEYEIDETAKTATLVWQHRPEPAIYGSAMGNAQRLPNGHTIIGWGAASPSVTEVDPEGREVFRLEFPASVSTYRAFRFEWPPVKPARASAHPAVLNARSGGWVTAVIEPEGFDRAAIVPGTITLAGVPADAGEPAHVRFPRDAVTARLQPGMNHVAIEGSLRSGERFRGEVALRLVGPAARAPAASPRALSRPGEWPLRVALGAGAAGARNDFAAFDARGRLVGRWRATPDAEGAVEWDGRVAGGAALPNGVYFIRALRPAAGGAAARVLLLH